MISYNTTQFKRALGSFNFERMDLIWGLTSFLWILCNFPPEHPFMLIFFLRFKQSQSLLAKGARKLERKLFNCNISWNRLEKCFNEIWYLGPHKRFRIYLSLLSFLSYSVTDGTHSCWDPCRLRQRR